MSIQTVFWDFNGTLLDDTIACVDAMNFMLSKRGMNSITIEIYKELFGFPVIDYYKKLGFTFKQESFEELSEEFMSEYNKRVDSTGLQVGVQEAIANFEEMGCEQVIISAMEQEMLEDLLAKNEIDHHFKAVNGLKDIYAKGKTHLAQNFIEEQSLNPDTILFIGDTLHDAEVANEIGCKLVLVSNGHHSHKRLETTGSKVVKTLIDVL